MAEVSAATDISNPDVLNKYKEAAKISQKVLETVSSWCTEDALIVDICERGDKLLDEEIAKVFKGKKIAKGVSHPTTVSPSSYVTPYTPLKSDENEAGVKLKKGEIVKIQLGAQIDGYGTIVCDSIVVGGSGEVTGRDADLLLATHYANEVLLRCLLPPGLTASTEEEKKKVAGQKAYTQSKINSLLEKVVKSYDCNIVESTTSWSFEHNEIEGKKKIILSPGDGVKGDGLPEIGEVWGVEIGVSLGSGKIKTVPNTRTTLHRRTTTTYGLKRPSSRATLTEITKKFGTFAFSLRQLEDERSGKVGIVECVRGNVVRQYEVVGDKEDKPVGRLLETIALTKNGILKLAAPPAHDLSKYKSDKKITDEEVLAILELPLAKAAGPKKDKKKKSKKKAKKPAAAAAAAADDDDDDDDEDSDDE